MGRGVAVLSAIEAVLIARAWAQTSARETNHARREVCGWRGLLLAVFAVDRTFKLFATLIHDAEINFAQVEEAG